jgi:hypothetical protein
VFLVRNKPYPAQKAADPERKSMAGQLVHQNMCIGAITPVKVVAVGSAEPLAGSS